MNDITKKDNKDAIIIAVIAMIASLGSPYILTYQLRINASEERVANWERQDKLAKISNEKLDDIAKISNEKLDDIHELVNSNLTSAFVSERNAHVATLSMMLEVIELKRANGHEPNSKTLSSIAVIEARINELDILITGRH